MPKLILLTVGTSALERCRNPREYQDLDQLVDELNKKGDSSQLYNNVKVQVAERLQKNTEYYISGKYKDYRHLSAEIASFLAMRDEEKIGIANDDEIILLYSDTVDGKLCAEVNMGVIKEYLCPNVVLRQLIGVRAQSIEPGEDVAKKFVNKGLVTFQDTVEKEVKKFCKEHSGSPIYINVTGGYKVLVLFSTILAYNLNMNVVYLYERSDKIIWIRHSDLKRKIQNPKSKLTDGIEVGMS